MFDFHPRIIIGALKGGSGKTILSLGLVAAWRKSGYIVAPFKKGPDFIDSGWLAFAAGRSCHNLDPFMMTDTQITHSFFSNSYGADISLIEGNRGLFDGLDLNGRCSTAELAKLLKSPVIIVVDVSMATRTMAAVVMGCQRFDPDLKIVAVVLNRVAGPRQESLVRTSIERYCGVPVIGSVPKLEANVFPERHMGLVPYQESAHGEMAISWARSAVEENLDLEAIWKLAHDVDPLDMKDEQQEGVSPEVISADPPRIGYVRDSSFWFYYPENLGHLKKLGAVLVEVDSMAAQELPELDALYIGGGFPETQAERLGGNNRFRSSLKQSIEAGLPVYAECGGLMYLGNSLIVDGKPYPMVGAIPLTFVLEKKPQGHGYTILEVVGQNPYYPLGEILRGHEFHYSRPIIDESKKTTLVFKVQRGRGLDGQRDGLCHKNLLATYTHLHAAGNPLWGKRFFKRALDFKKLKKRD